VTLIVSSGPPPVAVPDISGLAEADALAALEAAGLVAGERAESTDASVPSGRVISQDLAAGAEVAAGSAVAYTVSLGPPVEQRGLGGSLANADVAATLDQLAADVVETRGLPIGATPYDAATAQQQRRALAPRAAFLHDPNTIPAEEAALKRLGLLPANADLGALLDSLYGQPLPVAYLESSGRLSVRDSLDSLNAVQRGQVVREFDRAAIDQSFGLSNARVGNLTEGDRALARLALEQGDGSALMLRWAAANLNQNNQERVAASLVPGNADVLASMPALLRREYEFPFQQGRAFVEALLGAGGWQAVDAAWSDLPRSTEQILHPERYPGDRPVSVSLEGIASVLGSGWAEAWQQTMGELRLGVWTGDANAAAGWGGDRLVSLQGPDGTWAIVWQTTWDSGGDADQFLAAALQVLGGLPGAHGAWASDISGDLAAPVLVLLTSDADTLASVQAAMGVG
jgi:hypothetical protein